MCVIVAMESKIPSLETLKLCEKKNPHGGGISWVHKDKVHFKKGIQAEEIHSIAVEFGPPCIAHFRISTVGGVPKSLAHPFPIQKVMTDDLEGEASSVLFHNGHWKDWEEECYRMVLAKGANFTDGDWSDSKAMAWLTACSHHSFLGFLKSQRVAIQTPKTRIYYGSWEKKDETWYSNLNWEEKDYSKYRHTGKMDDTWWEKHGWTYEESADGGGAWIPPSEKVGDSK